MFRIWSNSIIMCSELLFDLIIFGYHEIKIVSYFRRIPTTPLGPVFISRIWSNNIIMCSGLLFDCEIEKL